ncbi:MAG: hypothetical protein MJE68_06345 [Proteobacteria bacterium]|nr:hypothetical protein [Pseudomonadota bacterium]
MKNYTVNISSDASSLMSVTTISANISKCSGKICEYELKVSPEIATICPPSSEFDDNTIMISVLAENMLGPGLPTDMIPIGKYSGSYNHLLWMFVGSCLATKVFSCRQFASYGKGVGHHKVGQ